MISWLFPFLVAYIIAQRVVELMIAGRNTRWLRERGGHEVGARQYRGLIFLHLFFFWSLVAEVLSFHRPLASWWWVPFGFLSAAQLLRFWSIRSLGHFWTTRIIVLPGIDRIRRGPYRFFAHPSYLAAAIELLALPMIFQAYLTAVVFTCLNIVAMSVRIPQEERALREAALVQP